MESVRSARRSKRAAGILVCTMLATLGAYSAPGAGDGGSRLKNVGSSGRKLPAWIQQGIKELREEIPALPHLPPGYALTIDDIVLVDTYRQLKPLISRAQYSFLVSHSVPSFVVDHRFPIYLVLQSPDLTFIESLCWRTLSSVASLQVKAILAHETLHVFYDPTQGLSDREIARLTPEELERRHEIAAYELQLEIVRRDLAASRYWPLQQRLAPTRVDLTTAIQRRLTVLKSGSSEGEFFLLVPTPSAPPPH